MPRMHSSDDRKPAADSPHGADREAPVSKLTFDWNCILDLDEDRSSAPCLQELLALHDQGKVVVRLVAVSASEKQQDGSYLHNFGAFQARLASLGLEHLELLKPPLYLDVGFLGWAVLSGEEIQALEQQIHRVLFPNQPFGWQECLDKAEPGQDQEVLQREWRRNKCDVLSLWCHIWYEGDVFVTGDKNFQKATKKPALIKLGAKSVRRPCETREHVRQLQAGAEQK
jgi:hypothetical protein